MDKEKILEMSRKENKDKDIAALEAEKKASHYALTIGAFYTLILFIWQILVERESNDSIVALFMVFNMVTSFSKYYSLKSKKYLLCAICWTFASIMYTVMAITSFYN